MVIIELKRYRMSARTQQQFSSTTLSLVYLSHPISSFDEKTSDHFILWKESFLVAVIHSFFAHIAAIKELNIYRFHAAIPIKTDAMNVCIYNLPWPILLMAIYLLHFCGSFVCICAA